MTLSSTVTSHSDDVITHCVAFVGWRLRCTICRVSSSARRQPFAQRRPTIPIRQSPRWSSVIRRSERALSTSSSTVLLLPQLLLPLPTSSSPSSLLTLSSTRRCCSSSPASFCRSQRSSTSTLDFWRCRWRYEDITDRRGLEIGC